MPFVHKDANGKITAVNTEPVEGAVKVAQADPALIDFIQQNILAIDAGEDWAQFDLVEDLFCDGIETFEDGGLL